MLFLLNKLLLLLISIIEHDVIWRNTIKFRYECKIKVYINRGQMQH